MGKKNHRSTKSDCLKIQIHFVKTEEHQKQNNTCTDALPCRHRDFFFFFGFFVFRLFVSLFFFLTESATRKPYRFLVCYILILSFLSQNGKSRRQRWEHRQQLLNPLPLKVKYFYCTAQ